MRIVNFTNNEYNVSENVEITSVSHTIPPK